MKNLIFMLLLAGSIGGVYAQNAEKKEKNNNTVNTGDTTSIMPFVILFVAAAVIAGVAVFIKKRKK